MKRVCLLTGGSGKFGSAFCAAFSSRYDIACIFHKHAPGPPHSRAQFIDPLSPSKELPENSNPVFAIQADLRNPGECERTLDLVHARFGRIDVVIHAAVVSVWGSIINSSKLRESVQEQFSLNVISPFQLSTLLVRRYWRQDPAGNRNRNCNIIHLSSVAASRLFPGQGQSVYASTKAALNCLTIHMADEFALYGIRVNALAPDRFDSKIPLDKVVQEAIKLDEGSGTGEIRECCLE
jgi:NAD(P)-dependent dehydrogenase (short-subunit alcohol dehydrogenase family)